MTTIHDELLRRDLPKWPQMFVTGAQVSVEQAKEIIRRTDSFFLHCGRTGNDARYAERVLNRLNFPRGDSDTLKLFTKEDEWKKKWGCIETEYVFNSWISCAYIGGPHGWCDPDGTIFYTDNIGKWPTIDTVLKEWQTLAQEFPFLKIGVTLMNAEATEENTPVVSMLVENGKVELVDPGDVDVHKEFNKTRPSQFEQGVKFGASMTKMLLPASLREQGVRWEWIEEWGKLADKLFTE